MYQKIKEYFEVHKQEMLDDIMAAIRIPSVNGPEKPGMPFGEENAKVLALAASLAKELGLKAEVLENKVAVIDLNEQPAELDILAHLDVVPAGDGWTVTERLSETDDCMEEVLQTIRGRPLQHYMQ